MIGTRVGRYHIQDKIGQGGMGVVYKAFDSKLNRTVALKFLQVDASENEEAHQRFIHEARATSALDHPNICTIYDIGESEEGHIYIAMAFYEGETLKSRMGNGSLPIDEATGIASQIAEGLRQAHNKGIVHRDVKPANIFITNQGFVKILDFGIAKMRDIDLTKTGSTMGTAAYMSPEQARGEEVDHCADIWSLGVILYEMLAGQRPFKGSFWEALLYAIVNEEAEPLSKLVGEIDPKLAGLVEKALAKDPFDRFKSMDAFLEELRALDHAPSEPALTTDSSNEEQRLSFTQLSSRELLKSRVFQRYVGALGALIFVATLLFFIGNTFNQTSNHDLISSSSQANLPNEAFGRSGTPTLAVLPLVLYGESNNNFYSEGLTHELTTTLTKIAGVQTKSPRSVNLFRDTDLPTSVIADSLNVDYVVDGSVFISDGSVRITANLIDSETDAPIWGESFTHEEQNILALQREVTIAIVNAIEQKVTKEDELRLGVTRSINPEALGHYYRGVVHAIQDFPVNAIENYERAIELDSTFAKAYARLSYQYWLTGSVEQAFGAYEKALELDNSIADAYVAKSLLHLFAFGDWETAEKALLQAIDVDPSNSEAHREYAVFLRRKGDFKEALESAKYAHFLDPFSVFTRDTYIYCLYMNRMFDEAIEVGKDAELYNIDIASFPLAISLLARDDTERAQSILEERVRGKEDGILVLEAMGFLAYTYAINGNIPAALNVIQNLEAKWSQYNGIFFLPAALSIAYVGMDDEKEALKWLDRAFEISARGGKTYQSQFVFDDMRETTDFQTLLEKYEEISIEDEKSEFHEWGKRDS